MGSKIIELTDEEWMSIIDSKRDGLPICCANVAALRDDLIEAARRGGRVDFFNQVSRHFTWVFPSHGDPQAMSPVMGKIADQLELEDLLSSIEEHVPQTLEI